MCPVVSYPSVFSDSDATGTGYRYIRYNTRI